VLSGEAANTNFIVVGLIRLGPEPMIYCTRGKHVNHYTTDVVVLHINDTCIRHVYLHSDELYCVTSWHINEYDILYACFTCKNTVQINKPFTFSIVYVESCGPLFVFSSFSFLGTLHCFYFSINGYFFDIFKLFAR
jgi:hypothetical protein